MSTTGIIKSIYRNLKYRYEVYQFDRYRRFYDTFSIDDKIKMAGKWLKQFPEQSHYEYTQVIYWFENFVSESASVIEIGGWRGDLAQKVLSCFPDIHQWHNYDLIRNNYFQRCYDPRYQFITLNDYLWNISLNYTYDSLIATHVIEHLSWKEFIQLARWIPESINTVLFEAPLSPSDENHDWKGDHSSHILEKGWDQVINEMKNHRFSVVYSNGNTMIFNRRNG